MYPTYINPIERMSLDRLLCLLILFGIAFLSVCPTGETLVQRRLWDTTEAIPLIFHPTGGKSDSSSRWDFPQQSNSATATHQKTSSIASLQSWTGYGDGTPTYVPQSAFASADVCSEAICTSLYIFSTKAPSSSNISMYIKERAPQQGDGHEVFRNVRSEDIGVASIDTMQSLDFSIFDSSGPDGADFFFFQGTITFPEVTRSSTLAVLSDSSLSYLWMVSDGAAQSSCANYNGSIIFNNAIQSGETVYVQATYPNAENTKNNIWNNGNKSECMWLEFGVDTDEYSRSVPWLTPVCQDGPVLWRYRPAQK